MEVEVMEVEMMEVESIVIGPSESLVDVKSVNAVAGRGLEGDRHYRKNGQRPGGALTLVESGVLADVNLTGPEARRQVVVSGTGLNDLVGRRFKVGEVECLGVELCEPCLHLQSLTRPGIIKELVHRAGLNADILTDGQISVGDTVTIL